MKTRKHYFKREATIADSDSVQIPINVNDMISAISVEYQATNGATSCIDHELHDDVSKIELVDGSTVLWSLSLAQARALNFFETKLLPHELCSEGAAGAQEESCVIYFGRFLFDPEYYFNPKLYNNPMLVLTHALSISATAGFATGTGKITVIGELMEEGFSGYKGFLSARERLSYTSTTSGDKDIELPRDGRYRMLLLKALITTYTPQEVLTRHRLSIDGDKYIPFDLYTEDIKDMNISRFGLVKQKKELLSADDGTALLDIYDIDDCTIRTTADDHLASIEAIDAEQIQNGLYDLTTPGTPALQTTAKVCFVTAYGSAPYAIYAVPFGDLYDQNDWLDSEKYGDVRLFSTQAVAGACSVILQQLRV